MAAFECRVRAGETANWKLVRQRATLAGDPAKLRAGDNRVNLAGIVALRRMETLNVF